MKNETRPSGAWEVRRRITLEATSDPEVLARSLDGRTGVMAYHVSPSCRSVAVRYDITVTDYAEI